MQISIGVSQNSKSVIFENNFQKPTSTINRNVSNSNQNTDTTAATQANNNNDAIDKKNNDINECNNNSSPENKNENENTNCNQVPSHISKLKVEDLRCPDCPNGGDTIEDPKSGTVVCTTCGFVVDRQFISDSTEWRTFSENDRSGPDPNRIGAAQHYLLQDYGDLSTTVGDKGNLQNLQRAMSTHNPSQKLSRAIRDISSYCARLNLPKDIANTACELFKDLQDLKELKQRKYKTLIATCVYIAAKHCHADRPLKELCEVFGVDRISVRKIHTEIQKIKANGQLKSLSKQKQKQINENQSTSEIFAIRYANELRIDPSLMKHIKTIVQNIEKLSLLSGKQPQTIAAAAIFLTCIVNSDESQRRSFKEIAAVARIGESTVQAAYRRFLYPKRTEIIPEDYGDSLRIYNLSLNAK